MSIKKKLGMGVATAALGITLVGGGTYAYFNDVDTLNNAFAAGTLNVELEPTNENPVNFDLSNMKPGDSVERHIGITNEGSLAIKEVLLSARASVDGFEDGEGTEATQAQLNEFLKQFQVEIMDVDWETAGTHAQAIIDNEEFTLYDFVNNDLNSIKDIFKSDDDSDMETTGRLNVAPLVVRGHPDAELVEKGETKIGLPADPKDRDILKIKVTFKETGENQNQFQGDSAKFQFVFEATQWDGVDITNDDENGSVNNDETKSADGEEQPDPITEGDSGNGISEAVTTGDDNPNE